MGIETKSQIRKGRRKRLAAKHRGLRAMLATSTTMDPDVKKVWVKALRSGEYKQGKNTMCQVDSKGAYSFCCLGVLADEAIDTDWHLSGFNGAHALGPAGLGTVLSSKHLDEVGLSKRAQKALAGANDNGLRFSTIADAIEECL